jgi:hypothetical protein
MLHHPHPFIFDRNSVLLPSCLTFLLLVALQPFEFARFAPPQLLAWSAFFAVLVGLAIFCCVSFLQKYFRNTIEERWTVKHEVALILSVLAVISLLIYALLWHLGGHASKFELFRLAVLRTVAIGFFPVLVLVLYEQHRHQKAKRQEAERLTQLLLQRQDPISQPNRGNAGPPKAVLMAENEKVALRLAFEDLYFVRSDGNYVEVFYQQNQGVHKLLVRNSLKAIEEQLPSHLFFRCHNRFLVNLNHIQKAEGNARNLELELRHVEERIPVSRSRSEALLQLFQQKA